MADGMPRVAAIPANFPPGGYYCIQPPIITVQLAENAWLQDNECIDGISAQEHGLSAVVQASSSLRLRRAVQQIAHYFHRELQYDFLQYCAVEDGRDVDHRAYLWTDDYPYDDKGSLEVLGACCFRLRDYKEVGERYALQWVWIHPYKRRGGFLKKAWPYFEKRFPGFVVETPLSPAMRKFLVYNTSYNDLLISVGAPPLLDSDTPSGRSNSSPLPNPK